MFSIKNNPKRNNFNLKVIEYINKRILKRKEFFDGIEEDNNQTSTEEIEVEITDIDDVESLDEMFKFLSDGFAVLFAVVQIPYGNLHIVRPVPYKIWRCKSFLLWR